VSDEKITAATVRHEHLQEINQPAHWAFLFGVLIGGIGLMMVLMALLGGGAS
jgi:hypothetical protein